MLSNSNSSLTVLFALELLDEKFSEGSQKLPNLRLSLHDSQSETFLPIRFLREICQKDCFTRAHTHSYTVRRAHQGTKDTISL